MSHTFASDANEIRTAACLARPAKSGISGGLASGAGAIARGFVRFLKNLLGPSDALAARLDHLQAEVGQLSSAQRDHIDDALLHAKLARQGDKIVARWNAQMFSQNFEDSIIAEILARIGAGPKTFVEIGVESGEECNTRLLLSQGWRGLWVEGAADHVARARNLFAADIRAGRLQIVQAMVTMENVQAIVDGAGLGELDFLSIDVDMNTSHLWRALTTRPRFACLEYNGNLPPNMEFETPYAPDAAWGQNAWYGASLKSLERIGQDKQMSIVGCDLFGINAFFVRDDLTGDHFLRPFTAENHFEPMRLHQVKRRGHKRP